MFIFNIKSIRESKNISLYELSNKTKLTRSYIRDLENNKKINPTLSTLNKIAVALNVNIKDLFFSTIEIENLKQEMYEKIDKYGINSKEVLEISRIIDLLINIEMQRK